MRNVVLVLEYDGAAYHGFQIQPSVPTIQGTLEAALLEVIGSLTRVNAAGRTDAGVHASAQVVNFRTGSRLPAGVILRALNAVLPDDVVVKDAWEAQPEFHARFSARGRAYQYSIWNAPVPTALHRLYTYHWRGPLDVEAMQQACQSLVGTHDFASFAGASDEVAASQTVRTVVSAECRRNRWLVEISITANAFLPHMVRNIVGTLLWVGTGKIDRAGFADIIAARDRAQAGPSVPARGLCLTHVLYDS